MKNFAVIGVAGYIAPKHLQAIKDTGNDLKAALDLHDSVGILDRFFPEASFFTEFERFDRYIEKLRREKSEEKIDYLSICTPNYLHDAHIRFALRTGCHAICEKPLVLKPWNLDAIEDLENETGGKVSTILQLRLHPLLIDLKKSLQPLPNGKKHNVVLTYITSRGRWYKYSWKGVPEKAGGLATNIGIHFFDLLIWLFGPVQNSIVHLCDAQKVSGYMSLQNANVRWYLSIDKNDVPYEIAQQGKSTFRSIMIDGKEIEFTDGFTNLHTRAYEEILKGNGFGISDARPSIQLVFDIRNSQPVDAEEYRHPYVKSKTNRKSIDELLM